MGAGKGGHMAPFYLLASMVCLQCQQKQALKER